MIPVVAKVIRKVRINSSLGALIYFPISFSRQSTRSRAKKLRNTSLHEPSAGCNPQAGSNKKLEAHPPIPLSLDLLVSVRTSSCGLRRDKLDLSSVARRAEGEAYPPHVKISESLFVNLARDITSVAPACLAASRRSPSTCGAKAISRASGSSRRILLTTLTP